MRLKIENLSLNFLFTLFLKIVSYFLSLSKNPFLRKIKEILLGLNAKLIYVIEEANWSIKWDGKYITENLKKLNLIRAEVSSPFMSKNKIIHFGSINCLFMNKRLNKLYNSNKIVLTWFHIVPTDKRLIYIPIINKIVDFIHTSCLITAKNLKELGFDHNKIIVIPLGVDLSHFKIFNDTRREKIKEKYKIPDNKIIIGSFQKDGDGWGEGLNPKYVKGPDIFCEVVKKLADDFNIHIFLTGPARGYVKKRMEEYNIPYTHIFLENYLDIVECYNVLDLYLITSRAEGGPKALLEGMATGVPIVSTKVGMAPEIIKNGFNGYITKIEDIELLYQYSKKIITNKKLRQKIINNGLKTVKNYDWELIAKKYYDKIYKRLMS